jgi:hypothetical protein
VGEIFSQLYDNISTVGNEDKRFEQMNSEIDCLKEQLLGGDMRICQLMKVLAIINPFIMLL